MTSLTAAMTHSTGQTDARLQRLRDQVLGTTAADFRDLAGALEQVAKVGDVVVLGSRRRRANDNQSAVIGLDKTSEVRDKPLRSFFFRIAPAAQPRIICPQANLPASEPIVRAP